MIIKRAVSVKEKNDLDRLLWGILWAPLGFPRDVRRSLKLSGPEIELVAIEKGAVVGGLVANRLSGNEIEIRHLAVDPGFQGLSIGKRLVEKLIRLTRENAPVKILAWARNTSAGFFARAGFESTGKRLEHPDFSRHGITFRQMRFKNKWSKIK